MGILNKFFNQTRKPEGFLGRLMIGGMNSGHSKLADWGMSHLKGINASKMIDLGCGGGRNADELLKRYPGATVTAVDYSELSVEKTQKYNRESIETGKCFVVQGDVASLPFKDGEFNLATAFETVYFWPGLEECFSEVARILKPGGVFMIVNESDGTDVAGLKFEKIIEGMKIYKSDEIASALKKAGFAAVEEHHHESKPWITILARK